MDEEMFQMARQAMARAHAPYSNFPVGAVVRGQSGALYAGCNVENAAYPEGSCAETAAIARLIMAGEKRLIEAAVIGAGDALVTPCGGCRQRLREFADAATPIHVCGPEGLRRSFTLGELLPSSFGPDHVRQEPDE